MNVLGALLLLLAALGMRAAYQAPFEILDTTVWQPLLPPLPGQFLMAYVLPQLGVLLAARCWPTGFQRMADKLLKVAQPAWLCPALVLLGSLLFRNFGLDNALYVSDELSFNFHAICLAGGRLGCAPPPLPDPRVPG